MKIVTLLTLFLFSMTTFAQRTDSVEILLKKRSFKQLDAFLTDVSHSKNNNYSSLNRQIVNSFSEIIIESREYFLGKEGHQNEQSEKISLITSGDKIIYYKLKGHLSDAYGNHKFSSEYSDDTSLGLLYHTYYKTYLLKVDVSEFLKDSVIYGSRCGIVGIDPKERTNLYKLVDTQDTVELDKWLCSPIAEVQVYAVEGFSNLKQRGYNLSPRELQLIEIIKSKKGTIHSCRGCNMTREKMEEITSEFKF